MIENKFPTKDISEDDIKTKFPLVAKKDDDHKSIFNIAGVEIGGSKLPIFAGPNMVESKQLISETAESIKKSGASFLRGGAFKPLTFPYKVKNITRRRGNKVAWGS